MSEKNGYKTLKKTFFTEKILGMYFIYHTSFDIVDDGWRPPIHEPLLIMGLFYTGYEDPLKKLSLKERAILYHKIFPENKIKQECSCGKVGDKYYFTDEFFNTFK